MFRLVAIVRIGAACPITSTVAAVGSQAGAFMG
jgi:hypothetical protein